MRSGLATVPRELTDDPLWQMEVYRLAACVGDLAWQDVGVLVRDQHTVSLSDQLLRAVGSIGANVVEGCRCQSGRDQARFYEYALGSTHESRGWYYLARHKWSQEVVAHRLGFLTQIICQLLANIPAQRGYKLSEEEASCDTSLATLLQGLPLPDDDMEHVIHKAN